MSKDEMK